MLLYFAIFLAELAWSYFASRVTVELIKRRMWRALTYDAAALLIAYEILAVLAEYHWKQGQILVAVAGGVAGTAIVAGRKKKKIKKKEPVNL